MTKAFAAQASAVNLTQSSPEYMGLIVDGIPPANESTFINHLNDLAPGTTDLAFGTEDYYRSNNNLCYNTCVDISSGAVTSGGSGGPTILGGGTFYLIAKYDASQAGSLVWYITSPGTYTVPSNFGTCGSSGCGISGWRLYQVAGPPDGGPSDVVPEPASLLLLGAGLSAAAVKARRRIANARV